MILLTRPLAQVGNLQSLLEDSDLDYVLFPTFEINKIDTVVPSHRYDVIIFISVNAVIYSEECFSQLFVEPLKVYAVGPITAKKLTDKGVKVDTYPLENASSQELLAMPECGELTDKKILIVRGKGGSETLKNSLKVMNQVDYFEVYRRTACEVSRLHVESIERFMQAPDGIVIANSVESLFNVVKLVKEIRIYHEDQLKLRTLIVLSERIKVQAQSIGFKNVHVARTPSDKGTIIEILNQQK
jgi:uroporphyrinogen-III synthase